MEVSGAFEKLGLMIPHVDANIFGFGYSYTRDMIESRALAWNAYIYTYAQAFQVPFPVHMEIARE